MTTPRNVRDALIGSRIAAPAAVRGILRRARELGYFPTATPPAPVNLTVEQVALVLALAVSATPPHRIEAIAKAWFAARLADGRPPLAVLARILAEPHTADVTAVRFDLAEPYHIEFATFAGRSATGSIGARVATLTMMQIDHFIRRI